MKGIWVEKTGGVEVLQHRTNLPVPQPKEDEVLVRNEFCGVNFIDTYFRTGLYASQKPEVLGREAAGHIVAPLSSSLSTQYPSLKEGTPVVYGYAEFTVVPAAKVVAVPASLPLEKACASSVQGLTALTLITEAYDVQAGDWILVPAAAGGTGGLLCQLLKARGAHVIASASTNAKRQLALKLGAEVAVGYDDVLDAVAKHTGDKGVAAVFDGVGKSTWETSLAAVARKGTIVSFGNASGAVEPIRLISLSAKNVKVCRPTLYNYIVERAELERYSTELWTLVESGKLDVPVHKIYPLADVASAHNVRRAEDRKGNAADREPRISRAASRPGSSCSNHSLLLRKMPRGSLLQTNFCAHPLSHLQPSFTGFLLLLTFPL